MLKTADRLNKLFNSNFGAKSVLSSLSVISVVILVVISGR